MSLLIGVPNFVYIPFSLFYLENKIPFTSSKMVNGFLKLYLFFAEFIVNNPEPKSSSTLESLEFPRNTYKFVSFYNYQEVLVNRSAMRLVLIYFMVV